MKQSRSIVEVAGIEETIHLTPEDVAAIKDGVAEADAGLCLPFEQVWNEIMKPLENEKKNRTGNA